MKTILFVLLTVFATTLTVNGQNNVRWNWDETSNIEYDTVLVNGVAELYEFMYMEGDEELPLQISVNKFKNILESTNCNPVDYTFNTTEKSPSPILIYSKDGLYLVNNAGSKKMEGSEVIEPFKKFYDVKVVIAKAN